MTGIIRSIGVVAVLAAAIPTLHAEEAAEEKPRIQIAILLDTSGSMSGLIDQAKTHLWKVVNEFATAEREGMKPEFQVALYEYGKDSIPAAEGYLRMIVPMTDDLDKVSEELFVLKTNGGSEFCGKVIKAATESLAWSPSTKDLKVIFIAGNEAFTQGDVDYKIACKGAITNGIVVNTIFCGQHSEGVNTNWKDGAMLADGSYLSINQNKQVAGIAAPQDQEIAKLGAALNSTYIAFGAEGAKNQMRQLEQDKNALAAAPASNVQRQITKSSGFYKNTSWDLVDAMKDKKVDLAKLKKEQLPENMQKMSEEEQKTYVKEMAEKRTGIQKQIQELSEARKKHVAVEMKKRAEKGEDTLDAAMIKTVREQASKKNFQFE